MYTQHVSTQVRSVRTDSTCEGMVLLASAFVALVVTSSIERCRRYIFFHVQFNLDKLPSSRPDPLLCSAFLASTKGGPYSESHHGFGPRQEVPLRILLR